ncbi:MAG: glycosyltransferase family 2 protein [Leptolyngbyaceae cyanobacterium SM2_5_2]|nr:glycosyltransferase family 2 protein [Leptolyngbyaceae cyanobacterium SM2_5_2]
MQTCPISVAIPTYNRPQDLLQALAKIQSCNPRPAEIIVHIDGGDNQTETVLASQGNAELVILKSDRRVGPGGGRNRAIALAKHNIVASFDDDSYPIDPDYFARLLQLFDRFPKAAVIGAAIYHQDEPIQPDPLTATWEHAFVGCGCAYRRSVFLATQGYVELPVAYGMEEVDVSLRLYDQGWGVLITPWLRVFHDTRLEHHSNPKITAASIANQALLAYLRYPPSYWWVGVGQVSSRILWLWRHGRRSGVWQGIQSIPESIGQHHQARATVSKQTLRRFLSLRKQAEKAL